MLGRSPTLTSNSRNRFQMLLDDQTYDVEIKYYRIKYYRIKYYRIVQTRQILINNINIK